MASLELLEVMSVTSDYRCSSWEPDCIDFPAMPAAESHPAQCLCDGFAVDGMGNPLASLSLICSLT